MAIRVHFAGQHKSIKGPIDIDLPAFTVLVGENGAGKTHLLELLYDGMREPLANAAPRAQGFKMDTPPYKRGEVVLESGTWGFKNIRSGTGKLQEISGSMLSMLRNVNPRERSTDEHYFQQQQVARLKAYYKTIGVDDFSGDLDLPVDFVMSTRTGTAELVEDVANAFVHYHLRVQQRRIDHGESEDAAQKAAGTPPWERLNEVLRASGIRYRCAEPSGRLLDQYSFMLIDDRNNQVWPTLLSSGERTILGLAMWLLTAGEYGVYPRVVLLDEADAHLHPALIPGFVSALSKILVSKYGCQVVLASHRTETACAAPSEALVEMHRTAPRLRASADLRSTVGLLTGNQYITMRTRRCVLVEDDDDVNFYNLAMRLMAYEIGAPEDAELIFQSASIGKGGSRDGGGRTKVEAWVEKLSNSGLSGVILGLTDRDFDDSGQEGIYRTGRHSLENYLLDPLVVLAGLMKRGRAPEVEVRALRLGDESRFREWDSDVLQELANAVMAPLVVTGDEDWVRRVTVRYETGQTLQYPRALMVMRGKNLIAAYQGAYNGAAGLFGVHALMEPYERVGLVPTDLADVLRIMRVGGRAPVVSWSQ